MIELVRKVDTRGLTSKAKRAVEQHNRVVKVNDIVRDILNELNFKLIFNSPGILSKTYFSDLESFLNELYIMWEDMSYPFIDEILVRTAKFDSLNMKMPITTIPVKEGSEIKFIREFLRDNEEIDQALLHPQVTEDTFKREAVMVRVLLHPDSTEIDLGYKGVQHVRNLEEANSVVNVMVERDNLKFNFKRGSKEDFEKSLLDKIAMFFDLIIPVIEDEFLEKEQFQKDAVFEFKLVPKGELWYCVLASWEVI